MADSRGSAGSGRAMMLVSALDPNQTAVPGKSILLLLQPSPHRWRG